MDSFIPPFLILGGLLWIAILFGIFLILRFFWLWYWKVDKIFYALERIDSKLAAMNDKPSRKKITTIDV